MKKNYAENYVDMIIKINGIHRNTVIQVWNDLQDIYRDWTFDVEYEIIEKGNPDGSNS